MEPVKLIIIFHMLEHEKPPASTSCITNHATCMQLVIETRVELFWEYAAIFPAYWRKRRQRHQRR